MIIANTWSLFSGRIHNNCYRDEDSHKRNSLSDSLLFYGIVLRHFEIFTLLSVEPGRMYPLRIKQNTCVKTVDKDGTTESM